jgi:anti-sigma regulatory factor (Ser/Thr protein kinase)
MVDATHTQFQAGDRSYFSIIKKDIHQKALDAGFDTKKLGDIDLIVSELTSNLHKYAVDGEILAGVFEQPGGNHYLELISIDHGPGMSDPQKMMADGYSSTNTLGMGLGSIKRLSDQFDLFSQKDWGTVILSRIYKKEQAFVIPAGNRLDIRRLIVAMPGQSTSGDGTYYKITERYFKMLVADGLGHGPDANYAVNEAVMAFKMCPYHTPSEIIRYIHQSIRKTRGIVATVVIFDFELNKWMVAGVGNISTRLSNFGEIKNQMSYNGIIGHNIPNTINDQEIEVEKYNMITLCSDGIKSRWENAKLSGIFRCDMTIQIAAIYKEFARKTDDMTVVMAKIK